MDGKDFTVTANAIETCIPQIELTLIPEHMHNNNGVARESQSAQSSNSSKFCFHATGNILCGIIVVISNTFHTRRNYTGATCLFRRPNAESCDLHLVLHA